MRSHAVPRRAHAFRSLRGRLAAPLLALLAGCSTDRLAEVRQAYDAGDYARCRDVLSDLEKTDSGDKHVYELDEGVVDLALERPDGSIAAFRDARDRMDELAGSDFWGSVAAMVLDDRQLPYPGSPYEHVLVRAMLALADLMRGGGDAEAYALQVQQRQIEIAQSFEMPDGRKLSADAFKLAAIGSYVAAIINEDRLNFDVAKREFQKVKELEPDFPYAAADLERVTSGHHSEKGNGVIHVIALVGRGPYRIEVDEPVTAAALAIAQVIWAQTRGRVTFPNIASVKIPGLAHHPDNPGQVQVAIDGRIAGVTATVTDVDATASKEFESLRDFSVARAVMRRVFKIGVTEGVKEAVNPKTRKRNADPLIDLGISLAGLAWAALEHADTRCWSLLPSKFQVLRVETPAGDHDVTLSAGLNGAAGAPQSVRVSVKDGYNTYVLALAPTMRGGPAPLASDRPDAASSPSSPPQETVSNDR